MLWSLDQSSFLAIGLNNWLTDSFEKSDLKILKCRNLLEIKLTNFLPRLQTIIFIWKRQTDQFVVKIKLVLLCFLGCHSKTVLSKARSAVQQRFTV